LANGKTNDLQVSFLSILITDVTASMERQSQDDSQQNRRDLIRAVFAAVEGIAWLYRAHVVSVARETGEVTSEEELALSEVSYQVTEQGKVTSRTRFISMPSLIRLTTRIATRLAPNLEVKFDGTGWEQFRQALAVRNRITHPKREADMLLSVEDISTCLAGFNWLLDLVASAMASANAAFIQYTSEFRGILNELKQGNPDALALYEAAARAFED
jgi:hypothetical protein